jgi:hypothetical protein
MIVVCAVSVPAFRTFCSDLSNDNAGSFGASDLPARGDTFMTADGWSNDGMT